MKIQVLFGGFALACAATAATVKSATLTVELDESAKGAVSRMVTANGAELGSMSGKMTLFELKATRADDFKKSETFAAFDATTFSVEKTAESVKLVYGGFKKAGVESVVCTVRGSGTYVRWGISVRMTPGWALEETTYPRTLVSSVLGTDGGDDRFVYGTAKGGVTHNPGAKGTGWRAYSKMPGPLVAQFATVYDDRAGFYFATEDGACHSKIVGAECMKDGILVTTRRIGFDEGEVVQAYEVVTGGFEGTPGNPCTWHDAADLYKKWAVRQTWTTKPFRDRDDVPDWMRDAPAMVRFHREWLQHPEKIRAWMVDYWKKEFVSAPLVMAYWGWEKRGSWVTPDYFPVVPDNERFAALVADMKKLGGHAFPWPSGYHWTTTYDRKSDGSFVWDDRARFAKIAETHAVFNRDGKRYVRTPSWLRGGDCACMCGGDPWTRNWWNNDICLPLVKLGCEMIQVNQVVGGAFPACWAKNHPHGPGEGLWKTKVFLEQLETMREVMRTVEKNSIVCVEEPCEFYNHLIGIQDYRDCECRAAEWASVFNYIYHEYVPCFQSNPRRGNRVWQAHEAADGQIPFLSPSENDLGGEHPALVNGDFEVASDGRFRGWEKLTGYNGVKWDGRMFVDKETRHDGANAIRLEVKKGENAVQVSQNVHVDDAAFKPGRTYRLSAWLKTDHSSRPNSVNYCFLGSRGRGGSLSFPKPEEGWKFLSSDFQVPVDAESLRIMMHLAGDAKAWVDSMKVEEVLEDGTTKDVILSGRGAYDAFMRRWVDLYHGEGRDWLAFGRQVKPPRLICASQSYSMTFHGGAKQQGSKPVAFCNAYESLDGRRAVVVVNATAASQTVTLLENGTRRTLTLAPDEIRLMR